MKIDDLLKSAARDPRTVDGDAQYSQFLTDLFVFRDHAALHFEPMLKALRLAVNDGPEEAGYVANELRKALAAAEQVAE